MMHIVEKINLFIDRWYLACMVALASVIIYLNWHGQGMAGILRRYQDFAQAVKTGSFDSWPTFPMWGYGWLMVFTENKLVLLIIQMSLAFVALCYFILLLKQEKLFSRYIIRTFKIGMIVSIPWYAFHALRWPYSIASSLFLISLILFYKAVTYSEKSGIGLLGSGLCFGLILHFRSDYFLMPLGLAFIVIIFFKTKRSVLQCGIWLAVIYGCMIPWGLYTKKACGHYLVTSTNGGHVMFIGLGNDPQNRWGIEEHDGDPLMHKIVDAQFRHYKHSTLDYEADQFLKATFFSYIHEYPWSYIKKCGITFMRVMTEGFYSGEFFLNKQGEVSFLKNIRIRHLLMYILYNPHFVIDHPTDTLRIVLTAASYVMGIAILFVSYLFLPGTLWHVLFRKRSLFILLMIAAIGYQTLLNTLCYHMPSYTSNLYVFYLLNAIYGMSLTYGFASDWYVSRSRQSRSVLGSRG